MAEIFHLAKRAKERGSFPLKFTIKDYMKLAVNSGNINSISWWLTDVNGAIINDRSNISLAVENPFYIVLEDEDLQITAKDQGRNTRFVTVRGTYESDLGTLPYAYCVSFDVENILVIDIDLYINVYEKIVTWDVA
jgi:hypothetical protein